MAAFKIKGRKNAVIEPTLGSGADSRRLPRMSTGQPSVDLANEMEAALKTIYRRGVHSDLIDQLVDGHVTLGEIWRAWNSRDADTELTRLMERKDDPGLEEEARRVQKTVRDARARTGIDQLVGFAPDGARFSWLTDFRHIQQFYRAMEAEGLAPNSVRRGPHRGVVELLTAHYGRGRMLAIMADVVKPGGRDERREMLWPDEIQAAYEKASPDFADVFGLLVTTGIDRKPLLALKVRDWNDDAMVLRVPDEKAEGRHRTLTLEPGMATFVRRLAAGKEPGDSLTGLTKHQVRNRWEALRDAIGRRELRLKDLRGTFATYAVMSGWPARKLQDWLGHQDQTMTIRYQRRLPVGFEIEPKPITERMKMDRIHLRVEEQA